MNSASKALGNRKLGMRQIRTIASHIAAKFRPEKIVLFGSAASKKSGPDSDVDLLIVMKTKESTWEKAVEISSSIKHEFPIDILVKTPVEIANRMGLGDVFIRDIMQNGKILYEQTG